MTRLLLLAVQVWIVFTSGSTVLGASDQKRVLLLYEDRSDLQGNVAFDRVVRSVLSKGFNVYVDVHSEYADVSPLTEADYPALQSWLRSKHAGKRFDVVVAVGGGALRFVRAYQSDLFPGAHIVHFGRREAIDNLGAQPRITGVTAVRTVEHVRRNFEFILQLQPDVTHVIVVSGSSPVDRRNEASARQALREYEGRIAVTYLAGLSLEAVQERLENLPDRTAILFFTMNEDGAGRRLLRSEVLSKLTLTASAPVYSMSVLLIDTGIVGGALVSQEAMAGEVGGLVERLLVGESIDAMPIRESPLVPMVNWRQLQRWRIPEDRLPQGTVVMYRDPSIWDLYSWHIIGVLSLFSLESMLIVALLVQLANRRRAESAMRESQRLLQSTIDALNAQVALLDETGKVIAVNQSWCRFAKANGYVGADGGIGKDYLELCASRMECEEAQQVADGIRMLMSGERWEFWCIHPCVTGTERTWFQVRVNRFYADGALKFVVACENVTEIKQAHDAQQQLASLLLRAQDEERRRIARDLHDVTVQNVATLKSDLIRIGKRPGFVDRGMPALEEPLLICDQVIKELRTLSYLLHPPLLDELGLVVALRWYIRGLTERSGIPAELLIAGNIGRQPADVETALFRVVQESLTNIHRHSGSPNATITLALEKDGILVRITDHGHGISYTRPAGSQELPLPGVGILGMRQRLKQFGGHLEIDSTSQGTTVTARIAISKENQTAHVNEPARL
jgi:two-component system NarL family sensor kinase